MRVSSRRGRRYDPSEKPITPTDVKEYVFCPLVTYYKRALGLRPVLDSQQAASREEHERLRGTHLRRFKLFIDRKLEGLRPVSCPPLYSERLNVYGELDLLLKSPSGELVPLDYKFGASMGGKAWPDHRAQLALYAMLVEEEFGVTVYRGYVFYIKEDLLVEVRITPPLRGWVIQIIGEISQIDSGKIPSTWRDPEKCPGGCGYEWVCVG